ncbi:MAG: hypothetical protein JWR77_599 [Rhizorhabdus sp.]|nr:hypothetical protein [Rhizorhabdus sp.]
MRPILRHVLGLLAVLAVPCAANPMPAWPDTPVTRLEMLALMQSLNAELLMGNSATLTLDGWCKRHDMASPAIIVADRTVGAVKPATAEQRARLRVGPDEPVRYRHVALRCGTHILSEADNWYVPGRLTPAMNAALDSTGAAFGRVVLPLHFHREPLSARLLWSPLPDDWDKGAAIPQGNGNPLAIPDYLIEHRALLALPDGTPISMVVESYTAALFAFAPPRIP